MPIRSLLYKYVDVNALKEGRSFLVRQYHIGESETSIQEEIDGLKGKLAAVETQNEIQKELITQIGEDLNEAQAALKKAREEIAEKDRQIASLSARVPQQESGTDPSTAIDGTGELRQLSATAEKNVDARIKLLEGRLSVSAGLFRNEFHKRLKEALQNRWLGGPLKESASQVPVSPKTMVFEETTDPSSGKPTVRYRYGEEQGYLHAEATDELVRLAKEASSVYWIKPDLGN